MALLVGLRGITGLCVGGLDLGSSCSQRLLIDAINLSFLLICSLSLLVASLAKNHSDGRRARNWVLLVVSFFCAATGMAYIAFYSWDALGKDQGFLQWGSLVLLVRGIVWISISVSFSFFRTSTWMQALVSAWWISFSLCISALNLKILMEDHALQILEAVAWPVNLMLLFCGFMLVHRLLCHDPTCHGLTEPLLVEEEEEGGRRRTGLGNAGLMSKMVFSWLSPLLRLGHSKPLNLEDIPRLDPEDGASLAYQAFAQAWELQRKDGSKATNLALFALGRCHAKGMLLVGLYALLRTLSVVAAPVLLYAFVQYSNREEQDLRQGLLLVGCFVVTKVVESLSQRHWFFNARRLGMRMRSSLMAAVFQKQLRLSSLGRGKHSTGEIVNYIAVDAYRLGEFPWWFHMAWTSPLQLVLAVVILFGAAGSGAAFGLIPLAICGVLNVPFAKILQNCQYRFMVAQDERLRATSEILNSMKIVKLQSWEEHFRKIIESLRDEEFKWLRESQMKKSYGNALYWMSPTIVSAVTFVGCAIMRSAPLNASTIFTVLAALRVMSEPVRMIPEILSVMIQVKVSLDRLDVFLLEDEIREDVARRSEPHNSDLRIEIRNGAFSWVDVDASKPTLENIDLEIYRGQKTAVCGPVGAGKSSILYAILGEIPRVAGSVNVHGSIAYVSQTSWIQSGTIQENILYGKAMNKKAYDIAIRACALDKDIENFSHGDLTEIGQRGLNLSGGQKQRIQLARAVYSDADIYLLDDPFSAVDAQTAAVLFNDCVMSALAKKTVILVTHQIEFLPEMNRILVVDGGEIIQSGSYEELLKSGAEFEKLVDAHQSAFTAVDPANHHSQEEAPMIVGDLYTVKQNSEVDISAKDSSKVQLTEDEEKEIGYGGWKPYLDYIRVSRSALHLSGVILSQIAFIVLQLLSTYWLAVAVEIPHMGRGILLGTYTILSVLSCFFAYTRSWVSTHMGLRASKAFFSGFIVSVFKAPMLFFDSTPVGRILTRASSDMSVLDYDIPFSIGFALAVSVEVAATIAVVAIVTWQVLVVAVPVMIAVIYVQRYYLASARELVRINGTTKAPVINYAAETSLGVVTIRAFAGVERFIRNNLKIIDTDAMLFFHTVATLEWILVRVEALQNITVLAATLLLVLLPPDTVAPGFVGLSLSYALNLSSAQTFLTRWYSSMDNYIISVERIEQFMHLPSEAPAIIDHKRPPSLWPYEGRIDLQDLKIKYRPNAPLVLKGISCTFAAGERVGVVGRTGSGKTTLISALFRLVEPAEGRILIDSLDICSIGLKDLRMKLSIIPQEPTLFRGSVRSNLDPLGQYSDQEIWEALEKCQLKATISSLPNLLDSSVSDEGENWSVGQRQLFCLGRVLLRRNRILVLDEATASIDSATDVVLQRIIRQEFSSCTVITVAHRVPTVMDSDMVMVLSYGKLVEYDKPSNLMGITSSYFSKLVAEYWSNCKRKSTQNLMSF